MTIGRENCFAEGKVPVKARKSPAGMKKPTAGLIMDKE